MIGHIKSGQYFKNITRAILKKYCPPCHKARGIHDFILATTSPSMDNDISYFTKSVCMHELEEPMHTHEFKSGCVRLAKECIQTDIARQFLYSMIYNTSYLLYIYNI